MSFACFSAVPPELPAIAHVSLVCDQVPPCAWHDFAMQPWSMNEVMLLGVLVSLTKIAELATVTPGLGMFALGGLIALLPAITVSFDAEEIWKRVEWADGTYDPEAV